ncbi:MAG: NAD-dependent isocitrate dehydrogenase, partial [Dokdonella sp.]|nr:NAD-dependent isocitrate dehydrogenase [Dokdonella sp.]
DHLQRPELATRLRAAIRATLAAADRLTPDLGGQGTTTSFAEAIASRLG